MIEFNTEIGHKLGLERLVEGLTGRKAEFIYVAADEISNSFAGVIEKGKVPVLVPSNLVAHNKVYVENAGYLEFLVALQAGRLMYCGAALNTADFMDYHARLFKEGFINEDIPVWSVDDFFATFEHRNHLARHIFEIVESARINACLKRDYLGFKQTLEDVVPKKFIEMLNGFGELPKQELDNMVLTLLQYQLLLGDLPRHNIKPKHGEHHRINAARKKGIVIKPFVRQCYDLLRTCMGIASVVLKRNSDLGDSFIATKKLHKLIFENTKKAEQHSSIVPPKKLDGIRGFLNKAHMIVTSDIKQLAVFRDKKERAESVDKEVPVYLEWNSLENKYIAGFSVHEARLGYSNTGRKIVPSPNLVNKLKREFSLLNPGGRAVLKKQRSGELDYERFVEYRNDVSAGITPDERVYQKVLNRKRDAATLILIDMSGSTNKWVNENTKLMDIIAEAVYYLSCGASQLDDLVGVFGYSSFSRKKTDFYTIADFGDACPDNRIFLDALSWINGRKHNHDGTAIRHATKKLLDTGRKNKLLIHISDGEPEAVFLKKDMWASEKDLPKYTGDYAWQDVRKALSEARARGVLPVCIRVNNQKAEGLEMAYGVHYRILGNPFNLQKVLCSTYKDLIS